MLSSYKGFLSSPKNLTNIVILTLNKINYNFNESQQSLFYKINILKSKTIITINKNDYN